MNGTIWLSLTPGDYVGNLQPFQGHSRFLMLSILHRVLFLLLPPSCEILVCHLFESHAQSIHFYLLEKKSMGKVFNLIIILFIFCMKGFHLWNCLIFIHPNIFIHKYSFTVAQTIFFIFHYLRILMMLLIESNSIQNKTVTNTYLK